MMEQKIEGRPLPTMHTAASEMESVGGDLGDIAALLFEIANTSGDFEIDPRAVRGVMLAVERVRDRANATAEQFHGASTLTQ